jgi:xanthine/CO dehydrogenase XdhC/CoxF family maturation factor
MPLAPLLYELFKVDPRWLDALLLDKMKDSEAVELLLPDGGRVRVEAERIKPLARTLIELFDGKTGSGEIRLSRYDVARINALVGMERWQFKGMELKRSIRPMVSHLNCGRIRSKAYPGCNICANRT